MDNEKLYTQQQLNEGITKAILDIQKVLKEKDHELEVYKNAFEMACWDLDNYTDTHYVTLMNEYLQRGREFIDYVKKAKEEEC